MSTHRQEQAKLASKAGGFFSGLLIGGLLGSGAALLFAPQSGKKTRAKLEDDSIELRDQVVDTVEGVFGQARGKAKELARSVRKETKELSKRGQDMLDEQSEVISDVVDAEKKAIRNMTNG
jgi:gas vesicle protein